MYNDMCKPTKGCDSRTKACPLLGALQRKHGNVLEQGPLGPYHARESWRRKLALPWSITKGPIWLLVLAEKNCNFKSVSLGLSDKAKNILEERGRDPHLQLQISSVSQR